MNRLARRARQMINPYSTAFAMWWWSCRSWRLPYRVRSAGLSARMEPAGAADVAAPGGQDGFRARSLLPASAAARQPGRAAAGSLGGIADREATRPQGAQLTRRPRAG